MEVTVNRESVREYVARQRDRYRKAGRAEKGRILDEVVAVTEYHRKSAVRLLSGRSREGKGGRVGRPVEYGPEVAAAAGVVHEGAGGIGAKRRFVGSWRRGCPFGELEMDSRRCSGAQVNVRAAAGCGPGPGEEEGASLTKAGTPASEPNRGAYVQATGTMRDRASSKWTRWRTVERRWQGSTCGR